MDGLLLDIASGVIKRGSGTFRTKWSFEWENHRTKWWIIHGNAWLGYLREKGKVGHLTLRNWVFLWFSLQPKGFFFEFPPNFILLHVSCPAYLAGRRRHAQLERAATCQTSPNCLRFYQLNRCFPLQRPGTGGMIPEIKKLISRFCSRSLPEFKQNFSGPHEWWAFYPKFYDRKVIFTSNLSPL